MPNTVNDHSINKIFILLLVMLCLGFAGCSIHLPSGILPLEGRSNQEKGLDPQGIEALKARYAGSISSAPDPLPAPTLVETAEVKQEIRFILKRNPRGIRDALARRELHYPIVKKIFEDEGLPLVMSNLAVIESGYNVAARSPVGALGMWQLMKSTARLYGLRVERDADDRRDPILSSVAAARHLRDLFMMYKDWYLALAAYNAGPGAVNRAMQKSGLNDFWSLSRKNHFCAQTRQFVPKFIAVSLIIDNPEKYGFVKSGEQILKAT